VLIRQERPAVRLETWEFPAGQIDPNGESARETALRELAEEAGLVCSGELVTLGRFFSSVGFTDEVCELFLATDCEPAPHAPRADEHEVISEFLTVSPGRLLEMIADGTVFDANTLSACARLLALGRFHS
jgi:ADP-ribose pyrophosphatase